MTDTNAPDNRGMGYTPEPWTLCAHLAGTDPDCPCGYMGNIWGDDEETIIAFMGHCQPHAADSLDNCGGDVLADKPTRIANARRIVACVNACKGIPTEPLEAHDGRVILSAISSGWQSFLVGRDEQMRVAEERARAADERMRKLEAALEKAADDLEDAHDAIDGMRTEMAKGRADRAITAARAALKGETP